MRHGDYGAAADALGESIKRGYRFVTTGVSPMSQPILTKNGFHTVTYAYAFEWGGNLDAKV